GDGMYKSIDAGKTWTHIGLEDTVKINKIVVDPKDPDLVLASTQGDARHSGQGIYRSTDGGKTWTNVFKPANANGTRDLEYAFDTPHVMFATSQGSGGGFGGGFGGGGATPQGPNGTALFKSTDAGKTWKKVDTLPPYTGRISVAIAMHTKGQRVYVIGGPLQGGSGLYRSDDQGATWQHMAGNDTRVANGQGTFSSGVWVDSQDPDILYTISTTVYRSTDGGKTFSAFKGAPGGEDPHEIWIDPTNGERMLFGFDQGPAVTLDGGQTWSGYYQIPIAQVYHIATDTRYPYWVMGSQQDTGAIMTRSRSDLGQITTVDWYPLQSSEFGTVVPDPLKPTTVYGVGYGAGQGNGLIKIDLATGQWGNVAPNFGTDSGLYTAGRDFWKRFDTAFDPKALYVGYNCILVTRDGAQTWKTFSPDLTTPKGQPTVPPRARRRDRQLRRRLRRLRLAGVLTCPDRSPISRSQPSSKGSSGQAAARDRSITRWTVARLGTTSRTSPICRRTPTSSPSKPDTATSTRPTCSRTPASAVVVLPRARNNTISIARTTAARPGLGSSVACPSMNAQAVRYTSFAKTLNRRACSSRGRRRPSTFHSTTAITGSRCGSICRARRSATWCFIPTIT
ncbi:MAG TPA: hypothetical protein VK582_06655, partial [Pyrinomonadaceae bacterium]|nr:hypothetical protein [Pyrinomonadaceae bacterium]